jgi:hypothetical protein
MVKHNEYINIYIVVLNLATRWGEWAFVHSSQSGALSVN